jgi:hypothetical protein
LAACRRTSGRPLSQRVGGFLRVRANALEPSDLEVGAALKASLVGLEVG